jgi:hypothetical protein
MTIYFSARTPKNELRQYNYSADHLEALIEAVNMIVNTGSTLISVYLKSEADVMTLLPVEAFDGSPIAIHLIQLQKSWERLLACN